MQVPNGAGLGVDVLDNRIEEYTVGETNTMTMIDALQIDCVELTGPTSGQGMMHLTSYHAQPQGYLNGGATLAFGEIFIGDAQQSTDSR